MGRAVQHDAPLVVLLVTEPAGDAFDLFDDAVVALARFVAVGVGTFSVRFTAVGDYTVTMRSAASATLFTLPTIHVSPK